MQSSDVPLKLPIPFGANAGGQYIRTIPRASQIGVTDGAASLSDGFPPLTTVPRDAGGIPPSIQDFNGILYEISGWARWVAAGGPVFFDADFAAAIGGYPYGAVVLDPTNVRSLYVSTVENNVTNPTANNAAGWVPLMPVPATVAQMRAGTDNTTFATPATIAAITASYDDAVAGQDTVKLITAAVLAELRADATMVAAGSDTAHYVTPAALAGLGNIQNLAFDLGSIRVQFGSDNTVTNNTSANNRVNFGEAFAPNTVPLVYITRRDALTGSYRAYNQKAYTLYGPADPAGFNWRLHDTDSSDASSYVYGFNWLAVGQKPAS